MPLKLMCCHGVCLAVKLPCCFSNPIQAKKNGEWMKSDAERRHPVSCCSVLSLTPTPSTTCMSLQLIPQHGLGKTASQVPATQGKLVAFPHYGSLGEHLPQLLYKQQSREGEGTFLGSQDCGWRTGGSRTNGNILSKVNRSRTGLAEVWCYITYSVMTEEEANGPLMEISKDPWLQDIIDNMT